LDTGLSMVTFDSKGYNLTNLGSLLNNDHLKWLCRVPSSIKEVKELYGQIESDQMTVLDDNYKYLPLCNNYGGVNQRWLLIHSSNLMQTKRKTTLKQIDKALSVKTKALKQLMKISYCCKQDAQKDLEDFSKKLGVCQTRQATIIENKKYLKPGKPTTKTPFKIEYHIQTSLMINEQEKQKRLKKAGFFVLVSNELDEQILPNEGFLEVYKGQDDCEKGFRFLKDPKIVSTSLNLKKNERIEALLMVMTLCLFVYACLEHKIQNVLKEDENQPFFKNQKGKLTRKPSARWVFHCFVGIHILTINETQKLILNLSDIHKKLLDLLGKNYWIYYS
jgi:transposase